MATNSTARKNTRLSAQKRSFWETAANMEASKNVDPKFLIQHAKEQVAAKQQTKDHHAKVFKSKAKEHVKDNHHPIKKSKTTK